MSNTGWENFEIKKFSLRTLRKRTQRKDVTEGIADEIGLDESDAKICDRTGRISKGLAVWGTRKLIAIVDLTYFLTCCYQ